MFAIVKTGSKQFKIAKNQIIKIEKISGQVGQEIILDHVLAVFDNKKIEFGLKAAKYDIKAKIIEHSRGKKLKVYKKKRRKNYERTIGHRQYMTVVKVLSIE